MHSILHSCQVYHKLHFSYFLLLKWENDVKLPIHCNPTNLHFNQTLPLKITEAHMMGSHVSQQACSHQGSAQVNDFPMALTDLRLNGDSHRCRQRPRLGWLGGRVSLHNTEIPPATFLTGVHPVSLPYSGPLLLQIPLLRIIVPEVSAELDRALTILR